MSGFQIRMAHEEDAIDLFTLANSVFHNTFAPDNTVENMRAYMESAFSPEQQRKEILDTKRTTLLVHFENSLIGYIQFSDGFVEPCVQSPKPIELARLYVDERWHGKGIASQLLETGISLVKERGFRTVWLGVWEHNPKAQKFYFKSGFSRVGEHIFQMGSDPQTDWVLIRELG